MTGTDLHIPTLATDRLTLRAFRLDDIAHEAEYFASDRSKHAGGPLTAEMSWRTVAAMAGHWLLRGYGFWAIEETATGSYCGHVGLWFPEGWPEPEIGWSLNARAEGHGIAHEAALAARRWAYGPGGWTTAISLIAQENTRSAALAKRLGAAVEGVFAHQRFGPMEIWRHPGPEALA